MLFDKWVLACFVLMAAVCSNVSQAEVLSAGKVDAALENKLGATQGVKVLSYNIRNGQAADGANHWDKRKHLLVDMIKTIKPDIIGLQESYDFQTRYLLKNLAAFEARGVGRSGDNSEHVNILVSKKRFDIVDSGTFWLSPTPQEQSRAWQWGAFLHRICTWVLLEDRLSGKTFYYYNTHLDHLSSYARENSAKLILEEILRKDQRTPFIVAGDFNAEVNDRPMQILLSPYKGELLLSDTFKAYQHKKEKTGTFNGFESDSQRRIDFILISQTIGLRAMNIYSNKLEGQYPSDHFPISAYLVIP